MKNIGDPFGMAARAAGFEPGEIDEKTLVWEAPGLLFFLTASAYVLKGKLTELEGGTLALFLSGLLGTMSLTCPIG